MGNPKIEIRKSGPALKLVSIQPNKNMFYGYPFGSAMDYQSATLANQILRINPDAKVIECSLKGCSLQFNQDMDICISGADMSWKLNDVLIPRYKTINVKSGQTLAGGFAKYGLRSYISFSKTIASVNEMEIKFEEQTAPKTQFENPEKSFELKSNLKINRGPEWSILSEESKATLQSYDCLLYTSPSPRDATLSRMPSSA